MLTVRIEPANQSVVLGDSLQLEVTVTNTSAGPSVDLIAHLDITDPASSSSVDPEDWTSTLSKPIGVIGARGTGTANWTVQPISPGTFTVYAVVISRDNHDLTASNVLTVDVADQRSLNPGGILPVALGMPALVGALLLARIHVGKRNSRPAPS
ncbi:MAG: BatD family protein [Ilumatobacteraceae bacterium]